MRFFCCQVTLSIIATHYNRNGPILLFEICSSNQFNWINFAAFWTSHASPILISPQSTLKLEGRGDSDANCDDAEKLVPATKVDQLTRHQRRKSPIRMCGKSKILTELRLGFGKTMFPYIEESKSIKTLPNVSSTLRCRIWAVDISHLLQRNTSKKDS